MRRYFFLRVILFCVLALSFSACKEVEVEDDPSTNSDINQDDSATAESHKKYRHKKGKKGHKRKRKSNTS